MHLPTFGRNSRSRTAFALLALVGWIAIEPAPSAAVRPPKLDYKMTTLENGLKVVLLEDHSTPIVHAELWYHVGSKNEKKGRTGFAHLFEHMMFKGSKNVEPEGHPSRISSIGGQSNASTNEDATIFWETFPAQYLPMVLWLEADRMATLRIDEKVFETEREVVKEERRMRVENQPYGKLNEIIYDQAFTTHPYKHPTIGSMADLEAASIEDVRDFFKTYYVPGNATLVLVGDFDSKEAMDLVTRYLGRVPKSNRPVPRDIPAEPPQVKERRIRIEENVPAAGGRRRAPHHLRRASRLVSAAHRRRRCSRTARARASTASWSTRSSWRWRRSARATSSRTRTSSTRSRSSSAAGTPEDVTKALIAELDRMRNEPITRGGAAAGQESVRARLHPQPRVEPDKAQQLAHAAVIHNDITTADGEFDVFQNMTAAEVQRVAQKYFTPENRLVITLMPKGSGSGRELPQ